MSIKPTRDKLTSLDDFTKCVKCGRFGCHFPDSTSLWIWCRYHICAECQTSLGESNEESEVAMRTFDVCFTGYRTVIDAVDVNHAVQTIRETTSAIDMAAAVIRRRSICPACQYGYVCVHEDGILVKER